MSLFFRTLRSGSSGNAQLLYCAGQALIIDLGLPANTALKQTLGELRQRGVKLIGALVTHEHGDHFSPDPLRALSQLGVPVHAPRRAIDHACEQLRIGFWSGRPRFVCVDEGELFQQPFHIGPFEITPIEVKHHPGGSCFAYRIRVEGRTRPLTAVIATDLCQPLNLPDHLVDADLISLESNHDPHLLKMRPNPSSHYHLENARCAALLASARRKSIRPPRHVCLTHLSQERNTPSIALDTLQDAFAESNTCMDFPVTAAPGHAPSALVEISA